MILRARAFTIAVYVVAIVFTTLGVHTMKSGTQVLGNIVLGVGCAAWWAAGFIGGVASITNAIRREQGERGDVRLRR